MKKLTQVEVVKTEIISEAGEHFIDALSRIDNVIEFDQEWKNGTEYLDGVVHCPKVAALPLNVMHKTVDDLGRQCIVFNTVLGGVVVFQRFTGKYRVLVSNMPRLLNRLLFCDGALTIGLMEQLIGYHKDSARIGENLDQMKKELIGY